MDWTPCLERGVVTLKCVPILVKNLFTAAYSFIGIISLMIIFYAAFKYIRSRGDQAAIDEAKRTLTYGLVGVAVVFAAFMIVNLVAYVTNAPQIAKPLGSP